MTVGEIVEAVDVGQSTVSHHLKILARTNKTTSQTNESKGMLELMSNTGTDAIRDHDAAAARRASAGIPVVEDCCTTSESCCGSTATDSTDTIGAGRYDSDDLASLPAEAVAGSIGCANLVVLAALVLDLGSGGGIDVLLSARRVGPTGRVTVSRAVPSPTVASRVVGSVEPGAPAREDRPRNSVTTDQ